MGLEWGWLCFIKDRENFWVYFYLCRGRVVEGVIKIWKDGINIVSGFRKKCLFLRDVIFV